jgi:hypothetical protein
MSMFDLLLRFAPSFHRHCSIRVVGEMGAKATFEAPPSGLLPRITLTLEVDSHHSAQLRSSCEGMLQGWDKRWSSSGLDGISVDGTFEISGMEERSFMLWSPPKNSGAHQMLAAALACFPPQSCRGDSGELLEIVRSYFGLQPAVVVMGESPISLRLAPWLHRTHASEVEQHIRSLPDGVDLIIDASGVERFGLALPNVLPMAQLRGSASSVRWVARKDAAEALLASGVALSDIEIAPCPRLTDTGYPVVLGGLIVSSPDLIALARNGAKIDLTRAIRIEHGITVTQAAQAAAELVDLVEQRESSSVTVAGS